MSSEITNADLVQAAESYIPLLTSGQAEALQAVLGASGVVHDHKFGVVPSADIESGLVGAWADWLSPHQFVKTKHLRTTNAGARVIAESIIHLTHEDGRALQWPFATVAVANAAGDGVDLYIYYTIWPILKAHTVRPPVFEEPQLDTMPSPLLQAYHKCLTTGDVDGLDNVLATDAYIRESSGPPYVHWGIPAVSDYFRGLFKDGAPLMRSERVTADERCTFLEFTVIGWNGEEWPEERHQGGAGIWEVNQDGLMAAVRVYDDIEF